jgi:4-hydroxy-4-methyl-2-oxoglutarate aldolase
MNTEHLEQIRRLGTCTVSNAIETFRIRLHNEGATNGSIRCVYEDMEPMIGYAVTGRIRSADPPTRGSGFIEHMEWWDYISTVPSPRILVLQDVDRTRGAGAFWDELQVRIHLSLGCVGTVTDGAVRDVEKVRKTGFHYFAGNVSVQRAYIHLVDFGVPVQVGGMAVSPGDLILADQNGVLSIPIPIASQVIPVAHRIQQVERQLIEVCESADFSTEKLQSKAEELGYKIIGPGLHHLRG